MNISKNNWAVHLAHKSGEKIKKAIRMICMKIVQMVLILYYVMTDSKVSNSDKVKVYSVVAYVIWPYDLIPDDILIAGCMDDLTALIIACKVLQSNVTPEIRIQAKEKLQKWFKESDKSNPA